MFSSNFIILHPFKPLFLTRFAIYRVSQSLATRTKEINAFYSGRVREYDLVEIQVASLSALVHMLSIYSFFFLINDFDKYIDEHTKIRAVIEMASKERDITALELAPVRLKSPLVFSVKRSVERFLEKRKKRSKYVTTPYGYTCSSTSSSSSRHS